MNSKRHTNQGMVSKRIAVGESFCFHRHYSDINGTQSAYAYYKDHKKTNKELYVSSTPIAIDTNILLNLYKMSFKERSQFVKFIEKNAYRIIIPAQVQVEYMRHRIKFIHGFQKTLKELDPLAKKIYEDLKKSNQTAIEQLKQLANRKIVSNDMVDVTGHIKALQDYIEAHKYSEEYFNGLTELYQPLQESLKKGVESSLKQAVYELDDPVLASLSKTQIQDEMSSQEKEFLQVKYEELLTEYQEHKGNNEEKEIYTFPGSGDWRKENDGLDPCGDFYIYHELLSYMSRNNQDVVLLTKDVRKSDWIRQDGKPFGHYIVDTYINTGHMLYIFNAQDFTNLTFEAVAESDIEEKDDDTADSETMASKEAESAETVPRIAETLPKDEHGGTGDGIAGAIADVTTMPSTEDTTQLSYFRDVTEERFVQELETALLWAESYGDGYVGQDYFIYSILGHKRFHFSSSRKVLEKLNKDGKVIISNEEHDDRMIKCLKINKEK